MAGIASARAGRRALVLGICAAWVTVVASARAENRLALRGHYYREASTRVVQPMLEGTFELPGPCDLGAHGGVDAISSASIAQGANVDEVFTETRYEGGVAVGCEVSEGLRLGIFARHSQEPDYKSYTGGVRALYDVWGKTGNLATTLAYSYDDINPRPLMRRNLKVVYWNFSYAQALSPTLLLMGGYEFFHLAGFYGNPYISHPNLGRERLPERRLRHAASLKVAQYFPGITLGTQLHYRFYFDQGAFDATDPWGMVAHTIEPRVYKNLGRDVELRLSYRYHWQSSADFWCNSRPDSGGDLGCYGMNSPFHSWDPKFGRLSSHFPELKVVWDLKMFTDWPTLGVLANGAIDISYGYFFQSAYYGQKFSDVTAPPVIGFGWTYKHGGAHVIQAGYSFSF